MSVIDDLLWLLKDGEWHDLQKIAEKVALSHAKTEVVFTFLAEYDFVQLNENAKEVKLQSPLLKFINKLQCLEQKTD